MATKNTGKKSHVPVEAVMSVDQLTVDPQINVRMRSGTEVYGVKISKDGYDLPTMMAQVLERGKILEPIHVSARSKDGPFVVLRGNRRTLAGQMLLNASDTPDDVKGELLKTRVLLFFGLTPEEERERVMDQNSKPFSRSEIIRYAWALRANGQGFDQIAVDNFEMWGNFGRNTRTAAKLADIRSIPENDIPTRRKAIKTWLRGTVDEYVIPAYDLGPIVRKACILSEMRLDGLLTEQDEKPYFITTRDPQKRMKELEQARKKDGSKWSTHLGGENFNAKIEEYHKADFPPAGAEDSGGSGDKKKRPSLSDLKSLANAAKSSLARMVFNISAGIAEKDFEDRDSAVSILEAKETLFLQYAESLDLNAQVSLRDILTQIFLRDNVMDFKTFLEKNCPVLPVVNAPVVQTENNDNKGDDSEDDSDEVSEGSDTEGSEGENSETVQTNEDGTFKLS